MTTDPPSAPRHAHSAEESGAPPSILRMMLCYSNFDGRRERSRRTRSNSNQSGYNAAERYFTLPASLPTTATASSCNSGPQTEASTTTSAAAAMA